MKKNGHIIFVAFVAVLHISIALFYNINILGRSLLNNIIVYIFLLVWYGGTLENYILVKDDQKEKDLFPMALNYLYYLWLTIGVITIVLTQGTFSEVHIPNRIMVWAGLGLFGIGGIVFRISRKQLNHFYSHKVLIKPNHEIISTGIYGKLRHPIYTSATLFHLCYPLVFGSFYGFVYMLSFLFFIIYTINIEERMLLKHFGNKYTEYSKSTYKLIPFIY